MDSAEGSLFNVQSTGPVRVRKLFLEFGACDEHICVFERRFIMEKTSKSEYIMVHLKQTQ